MRDAAKVMKRIIVLCVVAMGILLGRAAAEDKARVSSVSGRVTYSAPHIDTFAQTIPANINWRDRFAHLTFTAA